MALSYYVLIFVGLTPWTHGGYNFTCFLSLTQGVCDSHTRLSYGIRRALRTIVKECYVRYVQIVRLQSTTTTAIVFLAVNHRNSRKSTVFYITKGHGNKLSTDVVLSIETRHAHIEATKTVS